MEENSDGRLARGEARRATLLSAAVSLVARDGAGAVSHRGVAREAGVSLASVTYHFPTVDELRRATFDFVGSLIIDEMDLLSSSAAATPEEFADVAATFVVDLCGKHRSVTVAVLQLFALADGDAGFRATATQLNARLAEVFASVLGSQEEGAVAAAATQGIILVAVSTSANEPAWAARSVRAVLRQIGAVPGSETPKVPAKEQMKE